MGCVSAEGAGRHRNLQEGTVIPLLQEAATRDWCWHDFRGIYAFVNAADRDSPEEQQRLHDIARKFKVMAKKLDLGSMVSQ